jgi:hypothetical protein
MKRNAAGGRGALFCLFLLTIAFPVRAQSAAEGVCNRGTAFYENENYLVREVRIETPLKWLPSVDDKVAQLTKSLPIKAGSVFHRMDADAGFAQLASEFPELKLSPDQRFSLRLAWPTFQNCDDETKRLDVVYKVYTLGGASVYLSRAFESSKPNARRSVVSTRATERLAQYFAQPFIGYNRSRGLYGGSKLTIRPALRFLDKISFEGSGSHSSSVARAEAAGSWDSDTGNLSHMEWSIDYLHTNVPGDSIALKREKFSAQFLAATQELSSKELILRFGGAVEGGNRRTDLAPSALGPEDLASSSYSSAKVFVGTTMRAGRHSFKGSYGLQLGAARGGQSLDYVKQLFDAAASFRFLVRNHRVITLDAQFTAGALDAKGLVPVAERFFGGNTDESFINGDNWTIRSGPFIRSFPQNRFSQTGSGQALGGDRFISSNLTLAATVWGRPLVPATLLQDPDFPGVLETGLSGAESMLANQLVTEADEFRQITAEINPFQGMLQGIEQELNSIESRSSDRGVKDQVGESRIELETTKELVEEILKEVAEENAQTASIRELTVGFPSALLPSQIGSLNDELTTLRDMPAVPSNTLSEKIASLEGRRKLIADSFLALVSIKSAEAKQEMIFARRVVDQMLHEVNLIAVSPLVLFDAARLWRRGTAGEMRYAVGGGLRFGIVSLDVTAGYAWNPNPRPGEGRGAFLFTMELSNLFR